MEQELGKFVLSTKVDTRGMETDIKKMSFDLKKAVSDVERQTEKVAQLRDRLFKLENGDLKIGGTEKAKDDLEKLLAKIKELENEADNLAAEKEKLLGSGITASADNKNALMEQYMSGSVARVDGKFYSNEDAARMQEITARLKEIGKAVDENSIKAEDMKEKLGKAVSTATQAEIAKVKDELGKASQKLEEMEIKAEKAGNKLKTKMQETSGASSEVGKAIGKTGLRISRLAASAIAFSAITKAFTLLRQSIGNVMMSDESFRQSLYQLQAAFWSAFAPVFDYVIPAIKTLISWITAAVVSVGKFIAALTGRSYSAMVAQGKALKERADAYKNSAKSAGKSTAASKKNAKAIKDENKALEKQLASFDELNILQENKADNSAAGADGGSGTGGGVASAGDGGAFDGLTEDSRKFDDITEKLKSISVLVSSIGLALGAWKIYDFVTGMQDGDKAAKKLLTKVKFMAGMLLIIGGSILAIAGYSDAWVNGIDWSNFLMIIGGLAAVVGGVALAISPIAAAFVAVGAGVAALVLGVKDFIENGPSFQNILIIITGLLAIFAATLVIANLPIALIVTAIAALTAAFVILWNKSEGFRDFWTTLWEIVKTAVVDTWNTQIKPVFDNIKKVVTELWDNHIKPFWEENLSPALKEIGTKLSELWNDVIEPIIKWFGESVGSLWNDWLSPFAEFIAGIFYENIQTGFNLLGDVLSTFFDEASGFIDSFKEALSGIVEFIKGVFSQDWKAALNGIKGILKGVVNGLITFWESGVNYMIDCINNFLKKVNSAVSKVGDIVGKDWDLNLHFDHIKVPRLARGAVIPPNRAFMAVFGDQKAGTNIEAPLATIEEAVRNVLSEGGYGGAQTVILQLDGREVGRTFGQAIQNEVRRTGSSLIKPKIVFG